MKLNFRVLKHWSIKLLLVAVTAYAPALTASEKLVAAIENWPPYSDQGHPKYGIATEIVTTALGRAGYTLKINFENWPEILKGAEIGVYDVITAGWHSKEREKYFAFSEPYLFNEIKFIRQKNKPFKFETLDDLRGIIVGIVEDYAYLPEFDSSNIPIKASSRHVIQNLLLLQQGRIDLTLDDEWVIRHQLARYMPRMVDQFEFIDKPLARRGLHLLVSLRNKNHEKIITDFNQVINEMKEDGTINKIISAYKENITSLQH